MPVEPTTATIDITGIVIAVIGLASTVLTTFLIPYIKAKINKAHTDDEAAKLGNIKAWVKIAVNAAEMIYNTPGSGAEKLDYVMDYIRRLLLSKGITMDEEAIRVMVESAVLELKKNLDD